MRHPSLMLTDFAMGGLAPEQIMPVAAAIFCGLVVGHFWGLKKDYITYKLLALTGVFLTIPHLVIWFLKIKSIGLEGLGSAGLVVLIVGYPLATIVIGSLLSQPYHQAMTENMLLVSEERNKQLVKLAGNAIVHLGPDLEILDYNEEAERVFGFPRKYLIGRKYLTLLFPAFSWLGIENDCQRVLAGSMIREHEVLVTHKDGHETPMVWSFSRIANVKDVALGMIAIGQDITGIKSSERRLAENEERVRLALHGADLGMWDWNLTTDEVVYSERWASMLGYEVDELDTGSEAWEERIHPEDRAEVVNTLESHLSGESPEFEVQHRLRTRDGNFRWILSRGSVIKRSEDGMPVRMTGTHLDITEKIMREQKNQRLEKKLIYSQKMETIGNLAGGIAHDFNNILQSIIGYASLGKVRVDDSHPIQADLDRVLSSGERARHLVDQMLVFSRQSQQSRELIDIAEICRESITQLEEGRSDDSRITISSMIALDCPRIHADQGQMQQVVSNLCENAIQSMKERGGKLSLVLSPMQMEASIENEDTESNEEQEKMELVLTVADEGCGIAPEKHTEVVRTVLYDQGC